MALSAAISVGATFYSTWYMPPLWKELRGLAGDLNGIAPPAIIQQVSDAADIVESGYWAIQLGNVVRLGTAAILAPWPRFRLGVGAVEAMLSAYQFREFYQSIQQEVETLNGVAQNHGIPVRVTMTPNASGIIELAGRALLLQIDPAGQVGTFRQVIAHVTQLQFVQAGRKLRDLAVQLKRDYGDLVDVQFQFVPGALPIPIPGH
jgi:hypothetical protein